MMIKIENPLYPIACQKENDIKFMLGNNGKSDFKIKKEKENKSEKQKRANLYYLQDIAKKILPNEKALAGCMRSRKKFSKEKNIPINVDLTSSSDHYLSYGNLQKCKCIRGCILCASQISEHRRAEMSLAVNKWHDDGNSTMMMTFTNSHTIADKLEYLLKLQHKALKNFRSSTRGQKLFEQLGLFGTIQGAECTIGASGWHNHKHTALFVKGHYSTFNYTYDKLISHYQTNGLSNFEILILKFKIHWVSSFLTNYKDNALKPFKSFIHKVLKKEIPSIDDLISIERICLNVKDMGYSCPDLRHGLDIRDSKYVAKYITKLSYEITAGFNKYARADSFTPFQLLSLAEKNTPILNNRLPSKLFEEYYHDYKNVRHLIWSKGLKKFFGVDDLDDSESSDAYENNTKSLAIMPHSDFLLVSHTNNRFQLLESIYADIASFTIEKPTIDFNFTPESLSANTDYLFKNPDSITFKFLDRLRSKYSIVVDWLDINHENLRVVDADYSYYQYLIKTDELIEFTNDFYYYKNELDYPYLLH